MNQTILVINGEDFTEKLKNFNITCRKCGSNKVELGIDWAAYPSASWQTITVICKNCDYDEEIYST